MGQTSKTKKKAQQAAAARYNSTPGKQPALLDVLFESGIHKLVYIDPFLPYLLLPPLIFDRPAARGDSHGRRL